MKAKLAAADDSNTDADDDNNNGRDRFLDFLRAYNIASILQIIIIKPHVTVGFYRYLLPPHHHFLFHSFLLEINFEKMDFCCHMVVAVL